MICPHCGALLLDNAKYCESCGGLQPDYEQRIRNAAERNAEAESVQPAAERPLFDAAAQDSPSYTGFKSSVMLFFRNITNFSGRSTILEFWYGALFYLLASLGLNLIIDPIVPLLSSLLSWVLLIPFIALSVRRLHDVGRAGWWVLLMLTGIGMIPLLCWYMKLGEPQTNQWGESAETIVRPA